MKAITNYGALKYERRIKKMTKCKFCGTEIPARGNAKYCILHKFPPDRIRK